MRLRKHKLLFFFLYKNNSRCIFRANQACLGKIFRGASNSDNAIFAILLPSIARYPVSSRRLASLNIPTGVRRTPRRRHFRNSPSSGAREFKRTTINELQTQHSWLRSSCLFPSPTYAGYLRLSLSPSLLSFSLYLSFSPENYRGSVTVMHLPLAPSLSLSFSVFFSLLVYRHLFLSLFFPRLPCTRLARASSNL